MKEVGIRRCAPKSSIFIRSIRLHDDWPSIFLRYRRCSEDELFASIVQLFLLEVNEICTYLRVSPRRFLQYLLFRDTYT